jgi:hypothetical protein
MKQFFIILLILVLASCGSSSSSNTPQTEDSPDLVTMLFNSNPIVLSDSVSYYADACNNPSFQFLIPVNINNDSFIDFIAHFWCDSQTPAEIDTEDVPDALVAYISDGYGNYTVDNLDVFGELYPKLGGASRKYARGDINQDGKDDFAFAMNAEDGRAAYDNKTIITNYAYPAVLLSNETGYEITRLGEKDWGHSVQIKNNEALFGGHNSQAFKYENNQWFNISEKYDELSFASFLVYDEYIINSVRKNDQQGLELIKDNKVISKIMHDEVFKVYFEAWNNAGSGNYEQLGVYKYKNEYYFHGMITEMCRKDDLIVATINAAKPIDGEIIENEYYSQSETSPVVLLSFFEINNNVLTEKNISITDEEINHNYNFFDCVDINQDNKKDIIAQVFSQSWDPLPDNKGVPEIYINSLNEYYNLNTSSWPVFSIQDDSQGYLYDIDQSGTHDLVMFPLKANVSADIEIYLSNKNLID